jgi:hypothetical protein
MPLFVLDVDPIPGHRALGLRLSDEHGRHLGASQVRLDDHPAPMWEGLFDARGYVRRFEGGLRLEGKAGPATAGDLLARLGVFLGQHVLGGAITGALAAGIGQRTLLVRLPDLSADPLAAALARVPWELAWPSKNGAPEGGPLFRRNVVVRAVPAGTPPSSRQVAVPLGADEALRVLLVYAHAPGSRPLAARLERERIVELFFAEVLPKRRVTVDWLCHGVTRERLRERVQSAGGYHVVHWSGHGRHDALELAGSAASGGARDWLRGAELVELFAAAGGFIPHLVFLSACHSGSALGVKDWARLVAWLRDPGRGDVGEQRAGGAEGAGFSGAALELVKAGVPQVAAMRYEVTDAYARDLAVRFYRGLLGQQKLHAADAALSMARSDLAPAAEAGRDGYEAADMVTPLLFGAEAVRFEPAMKRSPQLDRARPQPQPLLRGGGRDLDAPEGFVGREEELSRLSAVLDAPEGPVAAVVLGQAGIGKSALAAEAIHLWHGRFDAVLAFQAKAGGLDLEELYRQVDARLFVVSPAYRARREANALSAVFLEVGAIPDGRDEILRENLIDVMLGTRVLFVIDHLEENLAAIPGEAGFASADPAWDRLLQALVERLVGSGPRVLVTSRKPVAALASSGGAIAIDLGPLPPAAAALFLETSEPLRALLFGDVGAGASSASQASPAAADGQDLAHRVLQASRGHPLILKRLGDLAKQGGSALSAELDRLTALGAGDLPDLFAGPGTDEERRKEQSYFEEAVAALTLAPGPHLRTP